MNATIAVTGLNASDNPAPGSGVIRALRADPNWRGRIVGLAYDALDTAAYDRELVDEVHLIPYPAAGSGTVLERLLEIHRRTRIDVLIPTLDTELTNFIRLAPELAAHGIGTLLPDASALQMTSKLELSKFCAKHGFRTPPTTVVWRREQLRAQVYPVAVKGVFHGAEIAHTAEEGEIAYDRLQARWGTPLLVQPFVQGEEYDVLVLGDGDGQPIGCVPMRKLAITDKGKAWAAVTVRDPRLRGLALDIFRALAWRGPLELEFVRDLNSGEYHLIEINPRFPAWCFLSVGAGVNLPAALARLILGKPLDVDVRCAEVGSRALPEARAGVTFVRHAVDLICNLDCLEQLVTVGSIVHNEVDHAATA